MNATKSLLAAITALTLAGGALDAQAKPTGVPIVLDPEVVALACTSLCNIVRSNAERACEEEVRADGEATTDELIGCLLQGIRAQGDCAERYCGE
jgi:hypothetical protein